MAHLRGQLCGAVLLKMWVFQGFSPGRGDEHFVNGRRASFVVSSPYQLLNPSPNHAPSFDHHLLSRHNPLSSLSLVTSKQLSSTTSSETIQIQTRKDQKAAKPMIWMKTRTKMTLRIIKGDSHTRERGEIWQAAIKVDSWSSSYPPIIILSYPSTYPIIIPWYPECDTVFVISQLDAKQFNLSFNLRWNQITRKTGQFEP